MANLSINRVILAGRLCEDVELKTTAGGVSFVQFRVAVNRRYTGRDGAKPEADFLTVVAWRGLAEFIARYFGRGSSICVCGSVQSRLWTDKAGAKRYAVEIAADEAHFVDAKKDAAPTQESPAYVPESYGFGADDGDMPF